LAIIIPCFYGGVISIIIPQYVNQHGCVKKSSDSWPWHTDDWNFTIRK
jgi:hypothetical protein